MSKKIQLTESKNEEKDKETKWLIWMFLEKILILNNN